MIKYFIGIVSAIVLIVLGLISFTLIQPVMSSLYGMNDASWQSTNVCSHEDELLSPDKSTLLYISIVNKNFEIFSVGTDGKNLRQLTHNNVDDLKPRWMPGGESIVFLTGGNLLRRAFPNKLCIMNPDGSNIQCLTSEEGKEIMNPTVSNNGLIAYPATPVDNRGYICGEMIIVDGKTRKVITKDIGRELRDPFFYKRFFKDGEIPVPDYWGIHFLDYSWSPDGKYLAFISPKLLAFYNIETSTLRQIPFSAVDKRIVDRWGRPGRLRWRPDSGAISIKISPPGNGLIEFGHAKLHVYLDSFEKDAENWFKLKTVGIMKSYGRK